MTAKPTLADLFVATPPHKMAVPVSLGGKGLAALQSQTRRAEKMVFDESASIRVGELLRDVPEVLVEQAESARPPFNLMWIEYDVAAVWETLTGRSNQGDSTADDVVGLLIDHDRVNVVSLAKNGGIGILPFTYTLHVEWPLPDQLRFAEALGTSRIGIDRWLWGSVSNHFVQHGRDEYMRRLRDANMVEFLDKLDEIPPGDRHYLLEASAGDFKNVIALLLLLNQPRLTEYVHVPARRGWIRQSQRPYMAHHVVNVSLEATKLLQNVGDGAPSELRRRRHLVRGHYCHDETARDYARIAGCVHDWRSAHPNWAPWPDAPLDEREHWTCRSCGGKRWWRVQHERGDGDIVDRREYRITTK